MKKVICALGIAFASVSSALATTYPLTIENCGYKETFSQAPERVVAAGALWGVPMGVCITNIRPPPPRYTLAQGSHT